MSQVTPPPSSDPRWLDIVSGRNRVDFDFLAAKILLGRLQMIAETDRKQETLRQYATQLGDLMHANAGLPSVQRDLQKIFG